MYAIASIKGTQYKLSKGDKLQVARMNDKKEGDKVTFHDVLMLANDKDVKVGAPFIEGAAVDVKILQHGKGDKIRVVKYKRRKRYKRTYGHRQQFTEVEITKIHETGVKKPEEKKETKKATVKRAPAKKEEGKKDTAKKETAKKEEKKEEK